MLKPTLLLMAALPLLAACHPDCPLCYQDAWSRHPFPGEETQHIAPLTPEELRANHDALPPANGVEADPSASTAAQ